MSYLQCEAKAALLAEFNARTWSGVALFNRGGSDVTMPTFSTLGAGIYRDALDFLNGRGVVQAESWPTSINTGWTGAGTVTIEVDEATGRLAIEADTEDFAIVANADNAKLGFDVAGHAVVGGAAPFRRVAPSDFELGSISDLNFTIDPSAGASFKLGANRWHADIITAMRHLGIADADDRHATGCLQYLDEQAHHDSVRWFLDEDGRVISAWETGAANDIVWVSTTFRDRLGFSGNEGSATINNITYLRADYPMPGCVFFDEALDLDEPITEEVGAGVDNIGASGASLVITTKQLNRIEAMVTGPSGNRDIAEHWRHRFLTYVGRAQNVTLYRMWGELRRRLRSYQVTASQAAHDLVYTTHADSYRGRQESYRTADDDARKTLSWEGGPMQVARVSMTLRES